jgi:hypothetical protein
MVCKSKKELNGIRIDQIQANRMKHGSIVHQQNLIP